MSGAIGKGLKVPGTTIHDFVTACINLNIVTGPKASSLTKNIEINRWYPFERLQEVERAVLATYRNSGPILERGGIEMMQSWYNSGPGRETIKKGIDFLYFQTGSRGYASVVRGAEEIKGIFKLAEIDEKKGRALVYSSTPFNKDLERGMLIGGLSAPGDLPYVDVNYDPDTHYFKVEFFGPSRKLAGLLKEQERDKAFRTTINQRLGAAYEKLDELTEELDNRLRIEEAIIKISSRFSSSLDIDEIINASLKELGELCGAERGFQVRGNSLLPCL